MEKHVNPYLLKQRANSKEGKDYQKHLEDINWLMQDKSFELARLQCEYDLTTYLYKKFLGYEVSEDDINKLKDELKVYDETDDLVKEDNDDSAF